MVCQDLVTNYAGLLTTRFFLGVFEASMFPGSMYLISVWYSRDQIQSRFAIFSAFIMLASAGSGLLALGIAKMDGIGGKASWRWVFILEGIVMLFVGVAAFFVVCDFPDQAKWLTESERAFLQTHPKTEEKAKDTIIFRDLVDLFKKPHNYFMGFANCAMITQGYAFAYYTPSAIKTFGYSTIQIQLHSVPPYAAAIGWYLTNLNGRKEPAIGSGYLGSMGNLGGFFAPFIFSSDTKTQYRPGFIVCLTMSVVGLTGVTLYGFMMLRKRRRLLRNGEIGT
ncbi:hypothetical protein VHEMI04322 [[Torrubiella] hemipterigena]|uniref:Major facilitator superfamily (MFS) profile domain-containing protein n=1 Tax=[Torrubiella] hemipterigena TaxID=1531966 RepID=A0A0A1SUY8_9HYPO|nr:hypothetical protein VHEMI04322 [[Torrubiella] hemipterigena]